MDGHGTLTWPDGQTYEGEFSQDKRNGHGLLTWPSGKSYNGQWAEGRQHGFGILTVGIKKIQGEWVEGKRSRWKDDSADNASTKNSDQNN